MLLSNAIKQQDFLIQNINANDETLMRLLSLGIIKNLKIRVMQNVAGNMIIATGNTRVSLGKDVTTLVSGEIENV